ncbi:MAG: hypothetical protein WAM82_21030 [Thermoanaerobaculia bacterium]
MSKAVAIREANRFFSGKTCVVTGRPTHNHWHHLDENHDNWNAANIVPVAPNINHDIEQLRKSIWAPISEDISSDKLRAAARAHYELGRFAESYGCSRLASFIVAKYESDPDLAVQFATEALHALRPLADTPCAEEFAVDALRRSIAPMLREMARSRRLRLETSFALCREIASYCLDHGEISHFEHWVRLADAVARQQVDHPPTLELLRLRLDQHRAFADLAKATQQLPRKRTRRMLELITKSMLDRHYIFGVSTNQQHRALSYVVEKRPDEADDVLRKTERKLGMIEPIDHPTTERHLVGYSWWTYTRLLLTRADSLLIREKKREALDHFYSALNIIKTFRIRALGATPFYSLSYFSPYYPKDFKPLDSQTGGPASRSYLDCAERVFRTLQNYYRIIA